MRELIQRAIAIVEAEREVLFSGHQVNGVVTVDDAVDQEAVDAINDMDAWLTEARTALQTQQEAGVKALRVDQKSSSEPSNSHGGLVRCIEHRLMFGSVELFSHSSRVLWVVGDAGPWPVPFEVELHKVTAQRVLAASPATGGA